MRSILHRIELYSGADTCCKSTRNTTGITVQCGNYSSLHFMLLSYSTLGNFIGFMKIDFVQQLTWNKGPLEYFRYWLCLWQIHFDNSLITSWEVCNKQKNDSFFVAVSWDVGKLPSSCTLTSKKTNWQKFNTTQEEMHPIAAPREIIFWPRMVTQNINNIKKD